jgi:hypothetical protein
VSSLATAPSRSRPEPVHPVGRLRAARRRLGADAALGLAIATALSLEVFVTRGGVALGANTWAEIVLVVVGAALCGAAIVCSPGGRAWGAGALVLFAALAGLTLLSISWSVQPADAWVEANRTFSYLAAFGGGLALARLAPRRWAGLLGAIALMTSLICSYALLVKVFPATLDRSELLGRLRAPYDYWNAVGLTAALGLPACVWAGARHDRTGITRALAVPAIGVLVITLLLSYSRGALVVSIAGLAFWFVVVPLRLRGAAVLVSGVVGGGAVAAWALATHPITRDGATLSARTSAGHTFGLVLVLMLVSLTIVGAGVTFAIDRVRLPATVRRRLTVALVALLACVPIGGVAALAASSRGITGEVSYLWHTLTSTKGGIGNSPGRLVQVDNSRGRYWSQGLKVGEHHLLAGVGAAGYGTASKRYSPDRVTAQHAHGYVIQTFADFGLIGLGLSLALLASWWVAARRALRPVWPRGTGRRLSSIWPLEQVRRLRARVRLPQSRSWRLPGQANGLAPAPKPITKQHAAERQGLLTLLAVVVIFGLHSAIDWTWFVPGVAVPALVCAGWLAGRGPLAASVARRPRRTPLRLAAVATLVAAAVFCAWTIWQPLGSADADQAALAALAAGNTNLALRDAKTASSRDPVSVEPLWNMAAIYGAVGREGQAHAALVRAVRLQPANPATWLQLGEYDLVAGDAAEAFPVLQAALYLAPHDSETQGAVAQARAALTTPAQATR